MNLMLENHESSFNRNRSLSCGSPLRNQVVYQEIYSFGQNTLVRSVSCNQVFSKDENGQTFETTQVQISSFITPEKKQHNKSFRTLKKPGLEINDLNNSITDCQQNLINNAKKPLLNTENKLKKTKKMCKLAAKYIAVALFSFFIYLYLVHLECKKTWDIKLTYNELQQKVFGQSNAIAKIELVLNEYNKTGDLHVMVFTGSVGIGKTYVSSIIYQNFPWTSKKILFLHDLNNNILYEKLINSLSKCGYNLIIFDDLTYQNVDEILRFLSSLDLKKNKNVNILIIPIFQTHADVERDDILAKFKNFYINYYHIPFQKLTEEAVKQCFLKEIKNQKAIVSETELKKLVKQKLTFVDVGKGPVGCKGIADEVSQYL